jgi:hypothetical protein
VHEEEVLVAVAVGPPVGADDGDPQLGGHGLVANLKRRLLNRRKTTCFE